MLNADKIKEGLSFSPEVICFDTIDSTNNEAKRLLESGKSAPLLIAARAQTAGRGRSGKRFYSPKDTGVYMTLCLDKSGGDFLAVTSAAAVAVCGAIEKLCGASPMIKWVNDIYLEKRKICGILCENAGDTVIIGIGINLTTTDFPEDIKNAGALGYTDENRLISEVSNRLFALKDCSYKDFIEYYKSRFLLTGKSISFTKNGKAYRGVALGADGNCGLTVKLENGEELTLTSGEISIIVF